MSVNKYKDHVFILPEDDANRQMANGLLLHPSINSRAIQVLVEVGGWVKVKDAFVNVHLAEMEKLPHRHMILLIDFDQTPGRLEEFRKVIPQPLKNRVFVIGAFSEPEKLRTSLGSFEDIGLAVARACLEEEPKQSPWDHELLKHNSPQVLEMNKALKQIMFI